MRKENQGFDLRHHLDRARAASELNPIPLSDLRDLAQFTSNGTYRPLKSAPNLRSGWRTVLANESELEWAMHCL